MKFPARSKLIVICGPTATRKSALAVDIALTCAQPCEIISADSRQVYRGLDIGSAKITAGEMQGVPHHLLDVADPGGESGVFTVADFQRLARAAIADIHARGAIPILVGGTGFYISAVVDGLALPEVAPNDALRAELETLPTDALAARLGELDPDRLATIDVRNRPRLVRAIEIAEALGKVPPFADHGDIESDTEARSPYGLLMIGLDVPKEVLVDRIRARITARIPALFEEIRMLRAPKSGGGFGVSNDRLHAFGLEYRYGAQFVRGEIDETAFVEMLAAKTWQYVKRQMTWFKRDPRIVWMNPMADAQKILEQVQEFLRS